MSVETDVELAAITKGMGAICRAWSANKHFKPKGLQCVCDGRNVPWGAAPLLGLASYAYAVLLILQMQCNL